MDEITREFAKSKLLINGEEFEQGSVQAVDENITFYEFETNTLIIRTVRPLRESTTYAVVLSDRIKDLKGNSIQSPFAFIHHTRQQLLYCLNLAIFLMP